MSIEGLFPFTRILDTNGDGTGSIDGAQDFSITPGVFFIQPPPGVIFQVNDLLVLIADKDVKKADRYGDIAAGVVTTGVGFYAANDTASILLNEALMPKSNLDWFSYGTPSQNILEDPRVLLVEVKLFSSASNPGIELRGQFNERIEVRLNDDFSGLDEHRFSVKGVADVPL